MGFHARNIMYNLPYMISDIVYTYMRTHKHKYIYIYIHRLMYKRCDKSIRYNRTHTITKMISVCTYVHNLSLVLSFYPVHLSAYLPTTDMRIHIPAPVNTHTMSTKTCSPPSSNPKP